MADFENVGKFLREKIQSKESSKSSFEKITDSNVGRKMLEKMGWKEGEIFNIH